MTVASRTDPVRARGTSQTGDSRFLGLDPDVYSYEACSKDAAAVNSEEGKELDRRLREYCASRPCVEVETALNEAQIGGSRIFGTADQYADEHHRMRDMTVPVLDRQSGVPIRVYGVVPKMSLTPGRIWRGAPSVGEETTAILSRMLGFSETHPRSGDGRETKLLSQRDAEHVERLGAERLVR